MQSELTRGYEAFRAQDLGPTAAPGSHVAGQRPAGAGGPEAGLQLPSRPHGSRDAVSYAGSSRWGSGVEVCA